MHLGGIPEADLRAALDRVEGKRPAVRLVAAIAHQHGVTQRELASWLGVERKTIYNWLTRLEGRPDDLAAAARDAPRPGRPSKLTETQRDRLATSLAAPPGEHGYDAPEWSPSLVRRYVQEAFEVEYTLPTCRRLLAELGDP